MTTTTLLQVLERGRESIVARFVSEIERNALAPSETSRPLLVDHIPRFLDEIKVELQRGETRTSLDAFETSATAREHGEQRWTLGYDLDGLIREYGVLRHCILVEVRQADVQLSVDEFDVLARCLSVGVAQAASEFGAQRAAELSAKKANLEFLTEAGQTLASSLDYRSTLRRLTSLIVPRLADWCAVHLEGETAEEMPILHVDPAKAEMLRSVYRNYPPKAAAIGFQRVVDTGESSLFREVDPGLWATLTDDVEQLALLRTIGTVSWLRVPLTVQGHVFGALTLGYSESRRHYDETDLALAEEVARRAAVALDNARLYALSQDARSRVEAATRAKDEFVAMVSHELRTPLNAILGWLKLMRSGTLPQAKHEHAFDVIERNAQAQSQLVMDLLDISRIITGKLRINPSQVDLGNVVEMAIEGVRPALDAKRIRIEVDLTRDDALMRGDGDRLQQVVWNLLANAAKFTPKNGTILVRMRRLDSDLEVTVEDDGAGIDASFLPHVFESFRQSDNSSTRPHGGLGIGLSIAKHIVDLHGGSIEARSDGIGRGALFRVLLPISPLVSTTMGVSRVPATRTERLPAAGTPLGVEGLKALVVDDEPDARELVTVVFESSGMEVRSAGSVAEAMEHLRLFVPDVIVSDIGMPEEDGYSLIRRIRTLPDGRNGIPAIALTAFARNEDRTRALVEGFNLHVSKPVEPGVLVSAVAQLAAKR